MTTTATRVSYPTTILLGALSLVATTAAATQGVSPGAPDRLAVVEQRCPTFSWQEAAEVAHYELVAYALPENPAEPVDLGPDNEMFFARVPRGATSWTPSAEQCFTPGASYVWFVRAVNELDGDEVVAASEWSVGRYLQIPSAPSIAQVQQALEVLRRYVGEGGELTELELGTVTSGEEPERIQRVQETSTHKSVPTASAAIRGEHPATSGEAYGMIGSSASASGAGMAASNSAGGADLVLDGSEDGQADTRLSQAGLDRPAISDQSFTVTNSGAGAMTLNVAGTVAATALDCPGCVTSATIASQSVTTNDLADDAVSEVKIEDDAVSAAKLMANAVTTGKIANNAVTSAKIADGTITAADIGSTAGLDADTVDGHHGSELQRGVQVFSDSPFGTVELLGNTCQTLAEISLSLGSDSGRVLVDANLDVWLDHTNGSEDMVVFFIDWSGDSAGCYSSPTNASVVLPSVLPTFGGTGQFDGRIAFPVSLWRDIFLYSGTHTFYFRAKRTPGSEEITITKPIIRAVFFPESS